MTIALLLTCTITMLAAIFAAVRVVRVQMAVDQLAHDRLIATKNPDTLLYVFHIVKTRGVFLTRFSSYYDDCCRKLAEDGLIREAAQGERPTDPKPGETYWMVVTQRYLTHGPG